MPRGQTAHGHAMRARILAEIRAAQLPPTNRELATALSITDYAVRKHIAVLIRDGLVSRTPRQSRTIRLTARGLALAGAEGEP